MRARTIAVASLLALQACATPARKPPVDAAGGAPVQPAAQPVSDNPVESVPLEVVMTDQTTTGRVMLVRGKIVNPHAEPVKGVRLQLVFLAPTGEGNGKVLEIQQKVMGSTLAPGASTPLRWDVESMYLGTSGHFLIVAYPMRLGDKDMPPPEQWKE